MWIRGTHLRGILLPLGVATAAIAALAWYDLVWIPAQQQYMNQRSLRLLRTMGAQIKAKVDNFDQAIDHAIDSYGVNQATLNDPKKFLAFQKYVAVFAPDLEIVEADDHTLGAELVGKNPGDPPSVTIQRDEGRNYLYLGSRHYVGPTASIIVIAKSDIEAVAAAFLSAGVEFDALLLTDRKGRVIAQQSPSGLELARVDSLAEAARVHQPAAKQEEVPYFETLRTSSNIVDVTLGDVTYKLYIQPVQLSLSSIQRPPASASAKPDEKQSGETRRTPDATGNTVDSAAPEEWALCGLVRADHFRGESSAISYTYLLWFSAALVSVILAIPLLKLYVLSPRERLRRIDSVWIAGTTFLTTALLTWVLTDIYSFGWAFRKITDDQLKDVATGLSEHLTSEMNAIWNQLEALPPPSLPDGKKPDGNKDEAWLRKTSAPDVATVSFTADNDRSQCVPKEACHSAVLLKGPPDQQPMPRSYSYPFFSVVAWEDLDGWQRVKWTTSEVVTPFINLNGTKLSRYQELVAAWTLGTGSAPTGPGQISGVDVLQSPNNGDILTLFWRSLDAKNGKRIPDDHTVLISQSISVTAPLAVSRPVLPPNVQFAIVQDDGLVMFHAQPTRSLKENFFEECEGNSALRTAVKGRRPQSIEAYYLGRRHRLYVRPLEKGHWSGGRPWSLVVLQDTIVPETVNLETLTLAVTVFGIYAVVVGGLWGLAYLLWPAYPSKWFWPAELRGMAYRASWLIDLFLAAVWVVWNFLAAGPTELLIGTGVIAAVGVAATFMLVTYSGQTERRQLWQRDFFLARAALLVIIAAGPAIACFRAAYEFETRLLIKSGQLSLTRQLQAREDRITKDAGRFKLCARGESFCEAAQTFIKKRRDASDESDPSDKNDQWDIYTTPFFDTRRDGIESPVKAVPKPPPLTGGRLDTVFSLVHRPYNDVGIDLQAAIDNKVGESYWSAVDPSKLFFVRTRPDAGTTQLVVSDLTKTRAIPGLWFWSSLMGLSIGVYLLVRFVMHRLFVLDLYPRAGVEPVAGQVGLAANVLLLGLPGSGKTTKLVKAGMTVVDVRTIRVGAPAFAAAQNASAPNPATSSGQQGQPAGVSADWVDSFDYSSLSNPVGIDHFEHRLDDAQFRSQMLRFVEELVYRRQRNMWIASSRDPLAEFQERSENAADVHGPDDVELDRWTRLFASFRVERILVDDPGPFVATLAALAKDASPSVVEVIANECRPTHRLRAIGESLAGHFRDNVTPSPEDVTAAIGAAADSYYRAVWSVCSRSEKVALRQLAQEGVVNPRNQAVVTQLMENGLIVREPMFRVMNETFRRFVVRTLSSDQLATWEREGLQISWGTIKATLVTVALGLGAMLVLTQQQLLNAWLGYVPTLAAAISTVIPTAMRLFGGLQRGSPRNTEAA